MEITINVRIGLSEELAGLGRGFLAGLTGIKADAEPTPGEPSQPHSDAQAAQEEAQPAQQPEEGISDARLREHMNLAIERFCGKGWENNTSPETAKIRRSLTAIFKNIASEMGAPKPTGLPQEKRPMFLTALDGISFDSNTGVCSFLPF